MEWTSGLITVTIGARARTNEGNVLGEAGFSPGYVRNVQAPVHFLEDWTTERRRARLSPDVVASWLCVHTALCLGRH